MELKIFKALTCILESNKELLAITIRQRAKFEGWLKLELAHYLESKFPDEIKNLELEKTLPGKKQRVDIFFNYNDRDYYLELKTSNSNWKIGDGQIIKCKQRPITKNITGVIKDINKIRACDRVYGYSVFLLFPIPLNRDCWMEYIDRIKKDTGLITKIEKISMKIQNQEYYILACITKCQYN